MTDPTNQGPSIDIFGEVLLDCFPDGRRILGGAPFNVAWHLQAFGAAPRFISAIGDDADGMQVRRAMREWGMDLSALQTDPGHSTGAVQVHFVDGEPHYEIMAERAFDHIRAQDLPVAGDLLYHGTLALRRPVSAGALDALKASHHALRVLDVNLREPWWSLAQTRALLDDTDWVKLNRDELLLLTDTREASEGRLPELAASLQAQHRLRGLVVTLGAEGALAVSDGCAPERVMPPPTQTVEDTVGAGDGFAAVLILGLIHDWPLPTTLARAQDFASRIVAQRGAIANDLALYRPFLDAWGLASATPTAEPRPRRI